LFRNPLPTISRCANAGRGECNTFALLQESRMTPANSKIKRVRRQGSAERSTQSAVAKPRKTPRRANRLDGKRWLQNSISVWSDIRKTAEETRLKHPAMFPVHLVERLIETFLPPEGRVVLDPFSGSGSTLVAAARMGKQGIGLELSPEYVQLSRR